MSADKIWEASLLKKKNELEKSFELLQRKRKQKVNTNAVAVVTLDEAIQHNDLESFQFAVQSLAKQFAERNVSTLIKKHIYPGLDHVRFFSSGISAATNSDPNASLVWGCLFIVIQVSYGKTVLKARNR
jgi:hypothetical protein